ncbi:MAG: hypothetical protein A2015_17300 [Spirochaetes bacterium GWF1_31_7]|nr:MAG: hypothetical protein A2Y30_14620 [Spirochaetes bacterium GWE1_32_154]OHD46854.1 MAG: hypothetical protein A2015_17300 [Spirochaetes bacterium GWF1_31_7]OHD50188.1 MAG: hypothetical protein A2Y29_12665 [Spirochaetes bacterium GWE2_31_10]OHD81967.1 MAG: hypothetical protein A2355_02005 [Spirochaetes bacterium RIFOXYB1_FULL_32_8]
MKKIIFLLLALILVTACTQNDMITPPSIQLKISESDITIKSGVDKELKVTVTPASESQEVIWSSSNNDILVVSSKGIITGIAAGEAIITASYKKNQSIKVDCLVHVTATNQIGDTLGWDTLFTLEANETVWFPMNLEKDKEYSIFWKDKNENYDYNYADIFVSAYQNDKKTPYFEVVDSAYNKPVVIKALKTEVAYLKITGTTVKTSGKYSIVYVCTADITMKSIDLEKSISVLKSMKEKITITADPPLSSFLVNWSSKDETIATVDSNGIVTGVNEGQTEILCTGKNDSSKTATCLVSVKSCIELKNGLWFDGDTTADKVDYYVIPAVIGKIYKILIDDKNNSSGSKKGLVNLKGYKYSGETLFTDYTYYYYYGKEFTLDKSENIIIDVSMYNNTPGSYAIKYVCQELLAVESVSIEKENTIHINNSKQLTATVLPEDIDSGVNWTTSDEKTVTVNSNGNVEALKVGEATIRATSTKDASKYAECIVKVIDGYPLTDNTWMDLTRDNYNNTVEWFKFDVKAGETYRIRWNDYDTEDNTKTCDIVVSAYRQDKNDYYFYKTDYYTTAPLIKPTADETVYLKVELAYYGNTTGTYSIKYESPSLFPVEKVVLSATAEMLTDNSKQLTASLLPVETIQDITWSSNDSAIATVSSSGLVTSKTTGTVIIRAASTKDASKFSECVITVLDAYPLINNTWMDVTRDTINSIEWFKFDVKAGETYRIRWNDYNTEDKTKTSDIYVTAYYKDKNDYYFYRKDYYTTAPLIKPTDDDTVYLKVQSDSYNRYDGTYSIKYETPSLTPVTKINLPAEEQIDFINSKYITASLLPEETLQEVMWSSADSSIAYVSSTGLVTAIKPGKVKIKATSVKDTSIYAECLLTVNDAVELVPNNWKDSNIDSNQNKWFKFNAKSGLTYTIRWNDYDTEDKTKTCDIYVYAYHQDKVDSYNYILANNSYTTAPTIKPTVNEIIYLKVDGSNYSNDKGTFAVRYDCPELIPVEKVELPATIEMSLMSTKKFVHTVLPEGSIQDVIWTTADSTIATVSEEGVVTPKKAGTLKIKATSTNDTSKYAECNITIIDAYSLTNNTWKDMTRDDNSDIWFKFDGIAGKTYRIRWNDSYTDLRTKTSDEYITVYHKDKYSYYFNRMSDYSVAPTITPVENETIYIKATGSKGTFAVKYEFPEIIPAESVILTATAEVNIALSKQLSVSVLPKETLQTVIWTSADESIATVSSSGLVTPKTVGNVTIKATSVQDSTKYAECSLTILDAYQLTHNTWKDMTRDDNSDMWFKFDGIAGKTYRIRWNDYDTEDKTKTCDISVSTYHKDKYTYYFNKRDNYITAPTITPTENETIYIKVAPENIYYYKGTFALRYECPELIPADSVVLQGTARINMVKTVQLTSSVLPKETLQTVTWTSTDESIATVSSSGLVTPKKLGNVKIKATSVQNSTKYAECNITVVDSVLLVNNTWYDGTFSDDIIASFKFQVSSGKSYTIQWNDKYSGDGNKTADVRVSLFHADKTSTYFENRDSGFTSSPVINPIADEIITILVEGWSYGTYAVKISEN